MSGGGYANQNGDRSCQEECFDNVFNSCSTQEHTSNFEEIVERSERSSIDVQIHGNGSDFTTRLSAGGHDMVNTAIVPVSRIFDCFRSLGSNPLGSDSISQTAADNLFNNYSIQENIPILEENVGKCETPSVDVQMIRNGGDKSGFQHPSIRLHEPSRKNNPVSQENVGKPERPSVDVQMIGNGGDVSARLFAFVHMIRTIPGINRFELEVLKIKSVSILCSIEDDVQIETTRGRHVLGYTASSSQMASVNHAYLCMDLTDYIIRPEIISFPNNSAINVYQNHCLPSTTVQFLELKKVKIHVSHDLHKLECITKLLPVGMYQDDLQIKDEDTLNPKIFEGLIHVLDEHNGLVRLFRTAQDRCSAGEVPSFKIRLYTKGGVHGYELLTSNILGGIVFEDGPNSRTDFDPGFFPDLILKPRDGTGKGKKVSMNAYYKYQLHLQVKEFRLIFRGGHLFQQYFVAVFCAIEQSCLDWVHNHQNDLRFDYLLDIVCGVFKQKVNDFIKILKYERPFGYVIAFIYTIEFQNKGLPHCHTLLWVDSSSKIRNATQINEYISAEIPDPMEDPRGYKVVTELMMHGPCGVANSSASCTKNGVYNKSFPKRSIGDASTTVGEKHIQVDEIQNYVDGRFICPFETRWRIFEFPIHCRESVVQIMNVHLENEQRVTFRKRDRLDIIVNMPEKKKTTLTEWVVRTKRSLRRLTYVHLNSGELFYFRMILCHQKGCKTPTEVRTNNGYVLPTYKAVCEALGLLGDDKEWEIALEQSTMSASSAEVRTLFAQILIYCDVSDPFKLWFRPFSPVIRLPIERGINSGTRIGAVAGVNINTFTMEQYLPLSRENQAPGVVTPEIKGNVNFEIKIQFMQELREETFSGNKNEDAHDHVDRASTL
nr:DNA helicase [Tanacetum cinerariifolium]